MPLLATFAGASARGLGFQAGAGEIPGLQLISTQSFSSVSSASLDNVFSDDYIQYKIVFDITGSSATALAMRLRTGGSDNSSTDYVRQYLIGVAAAALPNRDTSQDKWVSTGRADIFGSVAKMEILNPFQSTYTSALISMPAQASTGSIEDINIAFGITVTTSYDGFTVIPNTGGITLSGTISVYGYYKG